jgi:hypothetical protein
MHRLLEACLLLYESGTQIIKRLSANYQCSNAAMLGNTQIQHQHWFLVDMFFMQYYKSLKNMINDRGNT